MEDLLIVTTDSGRKIIDTRIGTARKLKPEETAYELPVRINYRNGRARRCKKCSMPERALRFIRHCLSKPGRFEVKSIIPKRSKKPGNNPRTKRLSRRF